MLGVVLSMVPLVAILFIPLRLSAAATAMPETDSFTFNNMQGFSSGAANLTLSGAATINPGGALALTDGSKNQAGHGFFSVPFRFKPKGGDVLSFSTQFIFVIGCKDQLLCGHGLTFAVVPNPKLPGSASGGYLGLFNSFNDGNASNRVVAVEFDTFMNKEFGEDNDDHIGIDINSVRSNASAPAAYTSGLRTFNTSLKTSGWMHAWVDYNGPKKVMTAAIQLGGNSSKPKSSLLSLNIDLASIIGDEAYVGFTASTGKYHTGSHVILGWSFALNGTAPPIGFNRAASTGQAGSPRIAVVSMSLAAALLLVMILGSLSFFLLRRRWKYAELHEDWEVEYGPNSRFTYKDLHKATGGFKDENFIGAGGFGKVYKGVLPATGAHVAVKKVSHNSRQGIKEFVAEIVSMRQLRHRNLVRLLGYCRREGELLLVYEFMRNGSLDQHLFSGSHSDAGGKPEAILNWTKRFDIIKGVASALLYLHEGWEQVVIHRDIKAGNVLLDGDYNGKLGDFGLARLYDRGDNPQTTHVVGTLGYLAPELSKVGKATTGTDVYAFGAFLLEVACGRRPLEVKALEKGQDLILQDWVLSSWKKGEILRAADPNLQGQFVAEEMELVLQLGSLCSQIDPSLRPGMRLVVQILEGSTPMAIGSPHNLNITSMALAQENEGISGISISYPSGTTASSYTSSTYIGNSQASLEKEMTCLLRVDESIMSNINECEMK